MPKGQTSRPTNRLNKILRNKSRQRIKEATRIAGASTFLSVNEREKFRKRSRNFRRK